MDMADTAIGIVGLIIGALSISEVWEAVKKSKYNRLKIKGYRETLLKYSLLLSASPIVIVILQISLLLLLHFLYKDEPYFNSKISYIFINLYLIIFYLVLIHSHMTNLVTEKIKKRYRIIEGIVALEAIISFITMSFNIKYLIKIWSLIYIFTISVYLCIYVLLRLFFSDTRKEILKEIRIHMDFTKVYNCYVITKFKDRNLKYLDINESYIEIKSQKDKIIKRIPMDKIDEITYHY